MPRYSLAQLTSTEPAIQVPTLVLIVRHNNAKFNYEYWFYGDDGRSKVEVYDIGRSRETPVYTISGQGSHYGNECQGFNYRNDCKHLRACRAVWNVWPVAARVYYRLESPLGPVSDHMLTTGTLLTAWLKRWYAEHAPYDRNDPEGFTVDLTI